MQAGVTHSAGSQAQKTQELQSLSTIYGLARLGKRDATPVRAAWGVKVVGVQLEAYESTGRVHADMKPSKTASQVQSVEVTLVVAAKRI